MLQKSSEKKEKDKKVFLDTSVIISYVFEEDDHHKKAVAFLEQYAQIYYMSPMAVFEICCVVPRKYYDGVKLPRAVQYLLNQYKTKEDKVACVNALILSYFKHSLPKVVICSDEEFKWTLKDINVNDSTIKVFEPYYLAIQKGHKLLQKAADMLHLAYISKVAQGAPVEFITFDTDMIDKAEILKQEISVEIRSP